MPFTQDEAIRIKSDVEGLKHSTISVLTAIGESVTAQKENTKMITDLVIELRERDVRDEYRGKEILVLDEKLDSLTNTVENNKAEYVPALTKLIASQLWWDKFWDNANSTWGKFAGVAIILGVAYALNIDLTKIVSSYQAPTP